MEEIDLKKTALYDFHVATGGKMVPFAGWSMPIQYKDSIMNSTVNCREKGTQAVITNEKGGAIDGSLITKVTDDHIYLVVKAGCRDKDLVHIEEHMKALRSKGDDDERSLLALQEIDLKKTALYDFHVATGGRMVPFAGWSMPIQYKDSIMNSTVNCREKALMMTLRVPVSRGRKLMVNRGRQGQMRVPVSRGRVIYRP